MAQPAQPSGRALPHLSGKEGFEAPAHQPIQKQDPESESVQPETSAKSSVYAGLGWLDRLLVVWILLAIIIGIVLGNFVDGIGPALQKGKFVDVSVPIGMISAR